MPKPNFTIGVFATIFDKENRILFCHRTDRDLWNLPGGTLEHGETPWDCVLREVKEETGLDVRIERLAGIYSKPDKNEIVFQFFCTVTGGKITLNDEADRIKYFAFAEIPKNTSPKQVDRVKDILENPDKLITKTQTGKSSFELICDGMLSEATNKNLAYCGLFCPHCYRVKVSDAAKILKREMEAAASKGAKYLNEVSNAFSDDINVLISKECDSYCRTNGELRCEIKLCCLDKKLNGCWECSDFKICDKISAQFKGHCEDINEKGINAYIKSYS